jgi:anti-sigma regulatory factor (Ser/Thr protein kinase)
MVVTGQLLVPYRGQSIALARRQFRQELQAHGCETSLVHDATLVLSELLSNAMQHARPLPPGVALASWEIDSTGVRILVSDGGAPTLPAIRPFGARSSRGRGLAIVATLAVQSGVEGGTGGTTVWALVTAGPEDGTGRRG